MAASFGDMLKLGTVIMVVRMVDFEDSQNLMILRMGYATVQSLCWLIMLAIFVSIKQRKERADIKVYETTPFGTEVQGEDQKVTEKTVEDYHVSQLIGMATNIGVATAIVAFLHTKWSLCPPLFMQSLMNPQTIYAHQLFSIHILRQDASKFPVPWTRRNPMDFSNLTSKFDANARLKKKKKEKELATLRESNRKSINRAKID